jgi:phage repressor protein C with HTH and peptisase S24 domain
VQTIDVIRHLNLRVLVQEAGGVARLAEKVGKAESQISQLLNRSPHSTTGRPRSVGSSMARELELAFGKPAGWMDVSHRETHDVHGLDVAEESLPADYAAPMIRAWEHHDALPSGEFVLVPRLDVTLSAGHGSEQVETHYNARQPDAFRADWIRKRRLKPNKLAVLYASGDSMEPRICDGDQLLVDTSQLEVIDGAVYAVWFEGGERVKRLYRRPGGGIVIRSDNTSRYPDMTLGSDETAALRIIGRVINVSGGGGL